mgnify:CR=1 FL=1
MTAVGSSVRVVPVAAMRVPAILAQRLGNREWDAALRATAVVGLAAIPIVQWVPQAAPLIPLVLTTLWMRGPLSAFIPAGLEPVLMLYGRLYPAWLVTLVAAAASAYAEILSLHLVRGVMDLRALGRVRLGVNGSRLMRLFQRRPALAVAVAAVSPIPDWITRTLAAVSRYPAARYVAADTLGRLPKLFIPAALGAVLNVPAGWLLGLSAGSVVFGAGAGTWKWWHSKRRARHAVVGFTLETVPGAGHYLQEERPDVVAAVVERALGTAAPVARR